MSIYEDSDKYYAPFFEERKKRQDIERRAQKINKRQRQGKDTTNIVSRQLAAQKGLTDHVAGMDPSIGVFSPEQREQYVNKYEYDTRMKPGRLDVSGNVDMGIGFSDFRTASKEQLRQRAKTIAFGGSGYKRQSMMNSLGMLTQHQKENWAIAKDGVLPKGMDGAPTKMLNGKMMYNKGVQLMPAVMTYGMTAFMFAGIGKNGENISEPFSQIAGFAGFDIGMGIGWNLGGSMVEAGLARYAAGALGAVAGGAALGVAAYVLTDMALSPLASSDTWMHSIGHKVATKDFLEVSSTEEQRQHISQRQRIYAKLSKTGLNDRGQFMGNEAMALRGII